MAQEKHGWLACLDAPEIRRAMRLGLRGIEKESLRVTMDGHIAHTPHPRKLGSALTHPRITTDYSEALLEFVTAPCADVDAAWRSLHDIHSFVCRQLDNEMMWATSMPCLVAGEPDIPIAEYGSSNVGRMKHVYRRGLGYRYGRVMQIISGVHFNYSVALALWPLLMDMENETGNERAYIDRKYFALLRNFQRVGWLVSYLFGSSPAVCSSFLGGRHGSLSVFDGHTAYGRYATSLRMSDIGYHNPSQAELDISYNHLDDYVDGLEKAIRTPYPPYERIGTRQDGEYLQLSTSILQIANEYYSIARPKQIAMSGEKPTLALRRRGVAYIEVRALDVDPFNPAGVEPDTMRFLECLLLYCLLRPSPPATAEERKRNQFNQSRVASCGRTPGLMLAGREGEVALAAWAKEICEALMPIAQALDGKEAGPYAKSVGAQLATVEDPEARPSARILDEMRDNEEPFFNFALRRSREYHEVLRHTSLSPAITAEFGEMATRSLEKQRQIEAEDTQSFEAYLQAYFSQS